MGGAKKKKKKSTEGPRLYFCIDFRKILGLLLSLISLAHKHKGLNKTGKKPWQTLALPWFACVLSRLQFRVFLWAPALLCLSLSDFTWVLSSSSSSTHSIIFFYFTSRVLSIASLFLFLNLIWTVKDSKFCLFRVSIFFFFFGFLFVFVVCYFGPPPTFLGLMCDFEIQNLNLAFIYIFFDWNDTICEKPFSGFWVLLGTVSNISMCNGELRIMCVTRCFFLMLRYVCLIYAFN